MKNNPFNRFSSTFAPGSVIKPITSAIGIRTKDIEFNKGIKIEGLEWQKENWDQAKVTRVSSTTKPVDLRDALVRSDNIYFAMKSLEIGPNSFAEGLKTFGFGEPFPFTYPF